MTVLCVITCEILELEFAYVLAKDPEIAGVTVLEDSYSLGLIAAMEKDHIAPRRIPILRGFTPSHPEQLEVLVRVPESGLHNRKRSLLIPNPTLPVDEMRHNIEEFNRLFGFRAEVRQGKLDMLKKTWETAKNRLRENTEAE